MILGSTSSSVFAQTTFQKAFGGSAMDEGNFVCQTNDGGYIIAGTTTSYGSGGRDVLVIKTNEFGDTTWTKTFGGEIDNEYGYCVQQTNDGGYIVSAIASSFNDVAGDIYLIKLNTSGDTLWTNTYGGIGFERGAFVQQTSDNGYIVCGQTPAFGAGDFDAYLLKINSNGTLAWTKTYGGIGLEIANSVKQTSDGGYIITGQIDTFGAGGGDILLIRIDASGNLTWSKTYGREGTEAGVSIIQTTDGGFLIGSTTENTLGPLGPDMCLIKTNSVGDTLWCKLYGGSMIDELSQAIQTTDGGYVMVGKSFSFSTLGDYDVYVVKVNNLGNVEWSKSYGNSTSSSSNEIGYSIDQTTDNGFVISGESLFGFGSGIKNVYLIKTDALGNSGCNQTNSNTISSLINLEISSPTLSVSTGGTRTSPSTIQMAGTIQTNLCNSATNNIIEIIENEIVHVYPNPSLGIFYLEPKTTLDYVRVSVHNVSGLVVYSNDSFPVSNSTILDLSSMENGVYFLKTEIDSKVIIQQIIIQGN